MAKQRQVRVEQGLPHSLMEDMHERTDEQLESESKHRAIALAILGARAAERYDAAAARTYFQRAIAASRPQERMQIRRMADAPLALAERRAGDLKQAVEKLGQTPPSRRALMGLRLMRLIVPPPGASPLLKVRGFAIVALLVIALLALGLGIVELIWTIFFGGIGVAPGLLLAVIVDGLGLAGLAYFGRRKQKAARAGGAAKAVAAGKVARPARGEASARATGAAGAGKSAGRTRGAPAATKGTTQADGSDAGGSSSGRRRGLTRGAARDKDTGGTGGVTTKVGSPANAPGPAKPAKGGTPANRAAPPAKPAKGGTPTTRAAPPAKPAKGGTPAKGPGGSSRSKRPSR